MRIGLKDRVQSFLLQEKSMVLLSKARQRGRYIHTERAPVHCHVNNQELMKFQETLVVEHTVHVRLWTCRYTLYASTLA